MKSAVKELPMLHFGENEFFGQFENIIDPSLFWQNFEWFDPSPAWLTHEWIWGQILKMLERKKIRLLLLYIKLKTSYFQLDKTNTFVALKYLIVFKATNSYYCINFNLIPLSLKISA